MKVSILTPTYQRRKWIPLAIECMKRQTWFQEGHEIEWIVLEDGDDNVFDLFVDLPAGVDLCYSRLEGKHTIAQKRNECIDRATTPVMIFWDDDDFYHPEYIEHMATLLTTQFVYGVVGSAQIYAWNDGKVYRKGKAGNHSPCGVLGFTARAVKQYELRFRDSDHHGEEQYFLKDFCVPLLMSHPRKTIIAIQHGENTWNVSFQNDTPIDDVSLPDWAEEIVKKTTGTSFSQ
jgi:glycosyltransferase involved in cell wall biosynthesis